jgi:pimeloyl-ACP methyl ester carboxylesterase
MKTILNFLKYALLLFLVVVVGFCTLNWRNDLPVSELKQKYANSESEFVEIDGMQVHYRDEGNALDSIPLVLIHGTGASLHTWEGWVKSLKANHRIIIFDLPAYGLTGPSKVGDYSQDYYVSFVDKLLTKLFVKKCVLGGNSLGGSVTWAYALAHPARVEKMILVDAGGYPMTPKSVPIAFQMARVPILSNLFKYVTPRSVIEKSLRNVYVHDERITDDLIDRYYNLALREGNRKAFIDRMKVSISSNKYLKIKTLTMPTLIIWGGQDGLIPLKVGEQFHQNLPNDTMVVFKDLGHTPMEEDSENTVKVVMNFLKKK